MVRSGGGEKVDMGVEVMTLGEAGRVPDAGIVDGLRSRLGGSVLTAAEPGTMTPAASGTRRSTSAQARSSA
jgi:hypothetical protein